MGLHLLKFLTLLLLCMLCACQSPTTRSTAAPLTVTASTAKQKANLETRNNALALLNELVNEERHLSKVLIIKRESAELKRLVKEISDVAGQAADNLKILARVTPGLHLTAGGLPQGERATRTSIAKAKRDALLHSKGAEFEFQLLITQAEALSYGTHLALIIAENEPQPARAQEFYTLSSRFKGLHEQVLAMLRPRG